MDFFEHSSVQWVQKISGMQYTANLQSRAGPNEHGTQQPQRVALHLLAILRFWDRRRLHVNRYRSTAAHDLLPKFWPE